MTGEGLVLAGAFVTFILGCLGWIGQRLDRRSVTQSELIDDLREERKRLKEERDEVTGALGRTLVRLGTTEAYAHELENRLGIPHRVWTEAGDSLPERRP